MNIAKKLSMKLTLNSYQILFSVSLFFLSIIKQSAIDAKVHVQVFYETFCPDSLHFLRLLGENYDDIASRITLELVPFGKAKITSNSVVCQHGPNECVGNKLHACIFALKTITVNQTVDFAYCWANQALNMFEKPFELARKCADESGLEHENEEAEKERSDRKDNKQFEDIERCARGEQGKRLLRLASNITPINIDFVPTVIFNRVYKSRVTSWALFSNLPEMLDKLESRMKYRD